MSKVNRIESEVCVVSRGMWLIVTDASSRWSSSTFWSALASPADRRASVRAGVSRGEAIELTSILDGTFLVKVIVDDSAVLDGPSDASWMEVCSLALPTGRIVVRSSDPGDLPAQVLDVEPGVYAARVEWFVEEESRHYDVEGPDSYPSGEGPDGIITLRLLGGDPNESE